jgi:chromosome partitioning protein
MIIGIINQKGGVGKTTLSISLAHALTLKNPSESVILIDADPQQSSLNWSEVREKDLPFTIIGLAKKTLHRDLAPIIKNYTHVIIDSPPRVTDLARSCIAASDIVIIPCTPSPYDIWASEETVNLVKEATIYKENLKYAFVINRKITNTAIGRDVSQILEKMEMNVFKSQISQRVVFAEAAVNGKTIFEIDPLGKAAQEIKNFTEELMTYGQENL